MPPRKLVINKFGGGIIINADAIKHLPEVFAGHMRGDSINVFSAFAKSTNNLEKIVSSYRSGNKLESNKILNELRLFHLGIAADLFPEGHVIFRVIGDIAKKISDTLLAIGESDDAKFVYDQVVPYGEILGSLIVSHYFSFLGINNFFVYATDIIKTDMNFGGANVDKKATLENLKSQIIPKISSKIPQKDKTVIITQGFIGFSEMNRGNKEKCMTTLGREGSDYTAGLLGNLMNADAVILWKDVPGVMEKNPKLPGNEDAKKIDAITYDDFEIQEYVTSNIVVDD